MVSIINHGKVEVASNTLSLAVSYISTFPNRWNGVVESAAPGTVRALNTFGRVRVKVLWGV